MILPLVDSRLITLPRLSVLVTVPLLSVVDRPEALAAGIVALAPMFGLFSIFGHDNTTTLAANKSEPAQPLPHRVGSLAGPYTSGRETEGTLPHFCGLLLNQEHGHHVTVTR